MFLKDVKCIFMSVACPPLGAGDSLGSTVSAATGKTTEVFHPSGRVEFQYDGDDCECSVLPIIEPS